MLRAASFFAALMCACSLAASMTAADSFADEPAAGDRARLTFAIQKATLSNGLVVVMNVERSAPKVCVALVVAAGSIDEPAGATGSAELLRALHASSGDLTPARGGSVTSETFALRTEFVATAPPGEIAAAIYDAARRLAPPDTSELPAVRRALADRRALQMHAVARDQLAALVHQGDSAAEHPVLGSPADLASMAPASVVAFHAAHYGARRAVLAIVGDFDPDAAMRVAEDFLGRAPSGSPRPAVPDARPRQTEERVVVSADERVRTPVVHVGFAVPSDETPAIEIARVILAEGARARLSGRLAERVRSIGSSLEARGAQSLLSFSIETAPGADLTDIENATARELSMLGTVGPVATEFARAKAMLTMAERRSLGPFRTRAIALARAELSRGDARLATRPGSHFDPVTIEAVRTVARRYLGESRRSIVEVFPPAAFAMDAKEGDERTKPAKATSPVAKKAGKKKRGNGTEKERDRKVRGKKKGSNSGAAGPGAP